MKIGEVSDKTGLSIHTIRYYEKQRLVGKPTKDKSGHRIFSTKDVELLDWVSCMKNSGMSLSKIREYSTAFYSDDALRCADLLAEHLQLLKEQQKDIVHYITVTEGKIIRLNRP